MNDGRRGVNLLDLAGITLGYGLAAVPARAYLVDDGRFTVWEAASILTAYLWLGLAMSGPFVLLFDRRARRHPSPTVTDAPARPPSYTGPERAWMLIGAYWLIAGLLIVPLRWEWAAPASALGLLPLLAFGLLWLLRPKSAPQPSGKPWTHAAAMVVLGSWPVAWIGIIALNSVRYG